MMLLLAILALPALLRFLVPATSALASGGGAGVMLAGAAGAAAMRMPSGAAAIHSTSSSYQHQAASHGATGAASAVDFSAGAVTGSPGLVGCERRRGTSRRQRPSARSAAKASHREPPGGQRSRHRRRRERDRRGRASALSRSPRARRPRTTPPTAPSQAMRSHQAAGVALSPAAQKAPRANGGRTHPCQSKRQPIARTATGGDRGHRACGT